MRTYNLSNARILVVATGLFSNQPARGFGFNTVFWKTPSLSTCGDSAATNCYDGTNSAALQAAGSVTTPSGKSLEYVYANGSSGFRVWKEVGGNRILRANGLDEWTKALNLNGRGLSATDFTDANLGSASTKIAGRACPPSVYVDDTNKTATGLCLYYDGGNAAQSLDAAGTSQTVPGSIGLDGYIDYSWYIGNIQTCASKGMRLPTLFETTSTNPGSGMPTDVSPSWANSSTGVPSLGGSTTWTSTTYVNNWDGHAGWNSTTAVFITNGGEGPPPYTYSYAVRCVVP
jgi:hypothetical protein